jgi:Na+(H+)/acetate symporter ActP
MQFFILLLGVMLFVFYQFHPAPMMFNQNAWNAAVARDMTGQMKVIESRLTSALETKRYRLEQWAAGDQRNKDDALGLARAAESEIDSLRARAKDVMAAANPDAVKSNDADYVFIHFVLHELPHGLIGLLIAVFFAATFSSKAAELNALASTTVIDVYRHLLHAGASDRHYVRASRAFTIFWGVVAIAFALFANMAENLIQAVNIVGSIFYGVVLAMFLVAFFLKFVRGTAIFYGAIAAQILVFVLYYSLNISYLWYNLIGCAACVILAALVQLVVGPPPRSV